MPRRPLSATGRLERSPPNPLKGFISYAHDGIALYRQFRTHLAATERAFAINFWADESIEAGHHWDSAIQQAIERAGLFILLLSLAYLSSDYIRQHEMPAIVAQAKAVNGLICPVILTNCAWEAAMGSLHAIPTRDGRLVPIAQWRPKSNGHDQARIQIEATIRSHFTPKPAATDWLIPLLDAREEQPGPVWKPDGDHFDTDPSGSDADMVAAAERATQQFHALNCPKAAAFAAKIARLANSLAREWDDLIPAARDLADVLGETTENLPDHIVPLWEASVRLASFLQMDKRMVASGSNDPGPLPADIHRALDDLVGSVAPFVRRFPSARDIDDERGASLANPALFVPAVRLFEAAKADGLTSTRASIAMESMIHTAERGGVQGDKARIYTIRGARGLISRGASYVAGFLAGAMASGYADQSPLMHKFGAFMTRAEAAITELVADFPADFQHALGRLRRNAGRPDFPYEDGAILRPPVGIQTERPQPPIDFDLERARTMILDGDVPPASWRPFITELDFSDTRLEPLAPLAALTALRNLNLRRTQVSDVAPLAALTALHVLDLAATRVSDVAPLAALIALHVLDLAATQVSDVAPLRHIAGLEIRDFDSPRRTRRGRKPKPT